MTLHKLCNIITQVNNAHSDNSMTANNTSATKPRTQAERRAATYKLVLDSACRLFGEKGYSGTSLEDIANDCGLTTRPIYHYFGNKKALFAAVNEVMANRILATINGETNAHFPSELAINWKGFLDLCDDPGFRQIVLIDSPNILGRERWATSPVTAKAHGIMTREQPETLAQQYRQQLISRMVIGALTEAALMVAEAEDVDTAKEQAALLASQLFKELT